MGISFNLARTVSNLNILISELEFPSGDILFFSKFFDDTVISVSSEDAIQISTVQTAELSEKSQHRRTQHSTVLNDCVSHKLRRVQNTFTTCT